MANGIDREKLRALANGRQEARGLARDFYLDPDVYAAEIEQIWRGGWLFVAHSCEIPDPGDYVTCQIDTDSILIVRDDSGLIRAFHNICRHRGTLLCERDLGHVGRIVCPYHQWTYDRGGRLRSARGMAQDLEMSNWSLLPVAVHAPAGMIYISLAERPLPFEMVERQLLKFATPQGLERARVAKCLDYEIAANWKLVWENNRECYHCNVNHPQYIKANFDHDNADDTTTAIVERIETQVARNRQRWEAADLAVTHTSTGMAPFPDPDREEGWCAINRTALADGYVSETLDGRQAAPLMGDYRQADIGTLRMRTMPNMWNHSSCDHAVTTRLLPAGPGKTRARVLWLVDREAEEGRDYELENCFPSGNSPVNRMGSLPAGPAGGRVAGLPAGPPFDVQRTERRGVFSLVPETTRPRLKSFESHNPHPLLIFQTRENF